MTYVMPSPSLMDSVGHSGTHAPQAMQSSVIFIVMVVTPSKIYERRYKITRCPNQRQLTNIFYLVKFVTISFKHKIVGHVCNVTYNSLLQLRFDLLSCFLVACQFLSLLLNQGYRSFVGKVTFQKLFEALDM